MISRPEYSIAARADGVVMISQQGFWSLETADSFTAEAEGIIGMMRTRGGLRVIIDATRFNVPAADVSDRLRDFDARIRQQGDKVAMVVDSLLLKIQMKRQIDRPGLGVFQSVAAAEEWLDDA